MTTQYIYDLVDTWNDGATTFTAIKMDVTDTASNAASLLMDLRVGGASKFGVTKAGNFSSLYVNTSATRITAITPLWLGSSSLVAFSSAFNPDNAAVDLFLTRRAAANLRLGAADAAAPVAQTLSVQSVVAGTSNTAGANLTITGSQGTGNAAGGSIIFQVAQGGSSGTAQNALSTALTISSNKNVTFTGTVTVSGAPVIAGTYLQTLENNTFLYAGASADLALARDAANTLALRNGTAAQEFRVYGTTDGTNSEYLSIKSNTGGTFEIGVRRTGTGLSQNGVINATNASGTTTTTCLSWGSFGGGFVQTSVGFSSAAAGTYDLGATTGGIGGAFRRLILSEYIETSEMTAPASPAANGVRIYAVDNGSGKTQLMALFATGVAQQIAIQP